jgi:hypothetical protein
MLLLLIMMTIVASLVLLDQLAHKALREYRVYRELKAHRALIQSAISP